MALGLKDLHKPKNAESKKQTRSEIPPKSLPVDKKKVLRPWESFNEFETGIRTYRAKEAIKKAKQRPATPNLLDESLKQSPSAPGDVLISSDPQTLLARVETLEKQERRDYKQTGLFSLVNYIFKA